MPSHQKKWRFVEEASKHMIRQFEPLIGADAVAAFKAGESRAIEAVMTRMLDSSRKCREIHQDHRLLDTQRQRFGRGACFFVSGDVVFVALPEHLEDGYLISAVFSLSVKLRETEERRVNLYNKGAAKTTRRVFLRGAVAYRR